MSSESIGLGQPARNNNALNENLDDVAKRKPKQRKKKQTATKKLYWWDQDFKPFEDESGGQRWTYSQKFKSLLADNNHALITALTDENNFILSCAHQGRQVHKVLLQDQVLKNTIRYYNYSVQKPSIAESHKVAPTDVFNSFHRYNYLRRELYEEAKRHEALRSKLAEEFHSRSS